MYNNFGSCDTTENVQIWWNNQWVNPNTHYQPDSTDPGIVWQFTQNAPYTPPITIRLQTTNHMTDNYFLFNQIITTFSNGVIFDTSTEFCPEGGIENPETTPIEEPELPPSTTEEVEENCGEIKPKHSNGWTLATSDGTTPISITQACYDGYVVSLSGLLEYSTSPDQTPMGQEGEGLMAIIEDESFYPLVTERFTVTNDLGLIASIEVREGNGHIYLLAWSLPVVWYHPGVIPAGGGHSKPGWYYPKENGDIIIDCTLGSTECDKATPIELYSKLNKISLDGIVYISQDAPIGTRDDIIPFIQNYIDDKLIDNNFKIMIDFQKSPVGFIGLFFLCLAIGIGIGIGLKVISYIIGKTVLSSSNYSRVKVVNYNDTETE